MMSKKARTQLDDEDIDPVENMLKKTGCIELHHKVQAISFNL
jgi:hypothetical protein